MENKAIHKTTSISEISKEDISLQQRIRILVPTTLICVAVDQITKIIAARTLPAVTLRFFYDTVRLHYAENQGAFLSLGAGLPEALRFIIFTVFSALVLIVLAYYILYYEHDMSRSQFYIWAFMFGGGISNLIDRLFRNGLVRDFLNVGIGNIRTGVFNLADVALTGGVIALIVLNIWQLKEEQQMMDTADPSVPDRID